MPDRAFDLSAHARSRGGPQDLDTGSSGATGTDPHAPRATAAHAQGRFEGPVGGIQPRR